MREEGVAAALRVELGRADAVRRDAELGELVPVLQDAPVVGGGAGHVRHGARVGVRELDVQVLAG